MHVQGAGGSADIDAYNSTSTACSERLPPGWDQYVPPFSQGGRRLMGRTTPRWQTRTLQVVDESGNPAPQLSPAHGRILLAADPSGGVSPTNLRKCPPRVHHDSNSKIKNITRKANPSCSGAGLAAHKKNLADSRRLAAQRKAHCFLTAKIHSNGTKPNPSKPHNYTLEVERKHKQCAIKPTPKAELDARDAVKLRTASLPNQNAASLGDKITNLAKALCYRESGRDCEVDYTGNTDWYEHYFQVHHSVGGYAIMHHALLLCRRIPRYCRCLFIVLAY